jgi:Amidase
LPQLYSQVVAGNGFLGDLQLLPCCFHILLIAVHGELTYFLILVPGGLRRLVTSSTVKQNERQERIKNLASRYHEPLGITDTRILNYSAAELAASVRAGTLDPGDILTAFSKKALKAHSETNCLTEIMISAAESWAAECNRQGPLAGIPISLKDVSLTHIDLPAMFKTF